MNVNVLIKDCAVLTDIELESMDNMASDQLGVGLLSKERDKWTLASQAYVDEKLAGFMFFSLERISGTPAIVLGVVSVQGDKQVFDELVKAQLYKTLMAFPDEDVLVTLRTNSPGPLQILDGYDNLRPSGEKPNGEQRALGRRIAKRFAAQGYNDQTMIAKMSDEVPLAECLQLDACPKGLAFEEQKDGYTIAWGWIMSEVLETFRTVE